MTEMAQDSVYIWMKPLQQLVDPQRLFQLPHGAPVEEKTDKELLDKGQPQELQKDDEWTV